jgi:hypothetical protein
VWYCGNIFFQKTAKVILTIYATAWAQAIVP